MLNEHDDLRVVGEANSRASTWEVLHAGPPDVIVMDVHLPGENGVDLSTEILAAFPRLKIVILSADPDLATVQRALQIGVASYLTKNDAPEEIVQAIRAVMQGRVHLCPAVANVVVQDYLKVVVNRSPDAPPVLTDRERLLVKLVAEGKRNKEIATLLGVGDKSVETYRSRLMRKLNCTTAAELTRYAIREGIITA